MIIILIVKKEKEVEIGRIQFYNTFVHLWFKCAFGPHETMNFEYMFLTKVIHFYVINSMDA
jgi:hypothetical protein